MNLESYAHKAAKDVVCQWMRAASAAAIVSGRTDVDLLGMSWRINRHGPHYGIWQEYPVLRCGAGACSVWDEQDDRWTARPPTRDELLAQGKPPRAIMDVAVQHKGSILYAVEIIHKSPVAPAKQSFLAAQGVQLIEWPASWVLGQIGIPSAVPTSFRKRAA